ncbi:MAG TPA: CBS domain-containing protein, partial [Pseudonocardiaceae bacterium]
PVHWMWWPAIGGLIIGGGGLVEPRALGVGYDVIDQLVTGRAMVSLIVGILIVKTLIWSMSLGSEVMNHDPVLLRDSDRIVDVLSIIRYAHLYPVLDNEDRLVGVTTRRALMECDAARVGDATSAPRALSHPDDTLRQVANNLAAAEVTRAPVVDRAEPDRVFGVITLAQLLHARRRDLHEEHHGERLLIVLNGQTEIEKVS